jgi:hypothetical protein
VNDVNLLPGFDAWANDPGGAIGDALFAFAVVTVLPDVDEAIGTPWPGGPNPPSGDEAQNAGRPFMRTNTLRGLVEARPPERDAAGVVVFVASEVWYAQRLIDRGYRFVPDRPYYRYVQVD